MRRARGDGGNALILVIVTLAALVAIAAPFALSMRLQERTARGFAAALRAEHAARAARDLAALRLLATHPFYERRAAVAQAQLADSPEDWDDPSELLADLQPLEGATRFEVRDPRGTILAAEIVDEQGKANLDSASGLFLGNLLGVAVLAKALDDSAKEVVLEGWSAPFYSDGDPATYDGVLRIGPELIVYRHLERAGDEARPLTLVRGCERGAFFSTPDPDDLFHARGELVHDARGQKLALHPLWAEMGAWRPYETVAAAREIAGWQLADVELARLFQRGVTPEILADHGLGGLAERALVRPAPAVPLARTEAAEIEDALGKRVEGLAKEAEEAAGEGDGEEKDAAAGAEAAARAREDGARVADAALRRLGRREGKKWIERILSKVAPSSAAARAYVDAAKARLKRIEDHERRWYRSLTEQAARLAEARDIETLSARELERLRDLVTVASRRPGEWAGGAVVTWAEQHPRQQSTELHLGVGIPEARPGAAARIERADGAIEYRRIEGHRRGAGPRPPLALSVFPQLEGEGRDWEGARVFVAPAHPVNVNTAPVRVLEALLTGLEVRALSRGRNVRRDFVTPAEAAAVARRMAAQVLRSHDDLALLLAAAVAAKEISAADRDAILTNAIDPGNSLLATRTAPFCYRGAEVATIVATGIVNDPAGNEVARHVVREVVAVSPPREATVHLDSQEDLQPGYPFAQLAGRRGNLVETHPVAAGQVDRNGRLLFPSRSHEPGTGEVRIESGRAADAGDQVYHFDLEPEGHDLSGGRTFSGALQLRGMRDPLGISRAIPPLPVQVVLNQWSEEVVRPGMIELWVRPGWEGAAPAPQMLFAAGDLGDFTDRVALFCEGGEIVLRVADDCLPDLDLEPWFNAAELRAPFAPRRDRWVHVAASWKGTRTSDLALFVDGTVPRGAERRGVAFLTGPVDEKAGFIPAAPTAGFPASGAIRVGAEVVEYSAATGSGFVVAAPGGVPARGARGSRARRHDAGTDVQVWGYAAPFVGPIPPIPIPGFVEAWPLETAHPATGALFTGGARLATPIPAPARTPTAFLKLGEGSSLAPMETRLDVWVEGGSLAAQGFPPHGFLLMEHELIFYRGLGPASFENVTRFVNGYPPFGWPPGRPFIDGEIPPNTMPVPGHYYGYEPIQLASIDVQGDETQYPAAWWVDAGGEWFRYMLASAIDWTAFAREGAGGQQVASAECGGHWLLIPPLSGVGPGASAATGGGGGQGMHTTWDGPVDDQGALYQSLVARRIAAMGGPPPFWVSDTHLHITFDHCRALKGTQGVAQPAGTELKPVYALTRRYPGAGDRVTLADATRPPAQALTIRHAADGDPLAEYGVPIELGVRLVTFRGPIPAAAAVRPADGARLHKHPTGGLPQRVPRGAAVGPLQGRIDEVRHASDALGAEWLESAEPAIAAARGLEASEGLPEVSLVQRQQGRRTRQPLLSAFHQAERGTRLAYDPDALPPRGDALAPGEGRLAWWGPAGGRLEPAVESGGLALLAAGPDADGDGAPDLEVIGLEEATPAAATRIRRGLLATEPGQHSGEALYYPLPFPPVARLQGGFGGDRAAAVPVTGFHPDSGWFPGRGYLAIDAGGGKGVAELLPYERVFGQGFERPRDDRRRGAYRGAFGTERDSPLEAHALVFGFPFRYFDRYDPGVESDDAVFWQATVAPAGAAGGSAALFRSVEWDESILTGDQDVVLLARVDGKPAWDSTPTNARGGIFRFDDPGGPPGQAAKENRIDVAGRTLEVRLVFPFKPGSYARGSWKETPRVGAVRVRYLEPLRVLSSEEIR